MEYSFCGSVCSDLRQIQIFLDHVLEDLKKIISDEDFIFETRLILSELAFNGALHGNAGEDSKLITVLVKIQLDKMIIKVSDEGAGCTYDPNSYDPSDKRESGRGLFLVQDLSDRISIQKNTITVIKSLN